MHRSLIYFWRVHLAVLLGAGVATAVLTGAFLVGDSVRGSLRDLTLDRLGRIDYALVSGRFFREALAADLSGEPAFEERFEEAVPAVLLKGSAVDVGTRSRASGIQIYGVDAGFTAFFASDADPDAEGLEDFLERSPGQAFPSVVLNASLQRELGARVGDAILLSFERPSDIHPEFLFGRQNASDIVQTLRLTLTAVVPDRGIGRFGLRPDQHLPLNAYVFLPDLQRALGQMGRANALFVARQDTPRAAPSEQALQEILHRVWRLEDIGLLLRQGSGALSLESAQFMLMPAVGDSVRALATERGAPFLPVLTYLANRMTAGGRTVPYSTVAALDAGEGDTPFGAFRLTGGSPAPPLVDDEILLNEWTARDLGVDVGDRIEVRYFVAGSGEQLLTRRAEFRLKGVLALDGLAADAGLTPAFPGIHDADDISSWEAPFPIDLKQIRPKDEAYWDRFGATPKAFVSEATGRRLWRSRFGDLTSIRVEMGRTDFEKALLEKIQAEQVGLVFQPVKVRGLEAASGATDFSMLFIGFSLFLIVSAALLVGLLFRLGVEQRSDEVGVLLAAGYTLAAVRRRFLLEGGSLAGVGGAVGLGGAVLYAWLMMVGLRTWWITAVGTPFLSLHLNPLSLVFGYVISVGVVLFSIGWTVRRFGSLPVRALLAGVTAPDRDSPGRMAPVLAFAGLGLAAVLVGVALVSGEGASVGLFFGSGALLLVSGLAFTSLWFRAGGRRQDPLPGFARIARLGARNSTRHPGRSLLCAALVGCACFVIVAVGANRRVDAPHRASLQKRSGTGGFGLVAESDVPLHHDLNSEAGRFELGFSDEDAGILNQARIVPFRTLPGEDVSCLNLYRPEKPRILGVPAEMIERGGFQFQQTAAKTLEERENPWRLLEREMQPGVIPAIGDYNSVLWILHLGLGQDVVVRDEWGQEVRLRLVGLLKGSLFQGELLVSESDFLKHFPGQSGYAYFLIQTPFENLGPLSQVLERRLSDSGFDATPAVQKLAAYRAVENTYLSTFQTLGGLGLVLGTIGLGIVLLRNAMERSGELATLRAFGFRRSTLSRMLLAENIFLLLIGLLIGSVSALIAVGPHLMAPGASVPWGSLGVTLALVFLVGAIASTVAAFLALRLPLLPALKAE